MANLSAKKLAAGLLLLTLATITSHAQVFTSLASFTGANGAKPYGGSLVQGPDGNFYGTTTAGGASNLGSIFLLTPDGTVSTLHSFDSSDGDTPFGNLLLARDGNFYGTTYQGGANGSGTIFRISTSGVLSTLHSFCSQARCPDGENPRAGLVQGIDGNFYGTASQGGANGFGTAFKVSGAGAYTVLYNFCGQAGCADGADPFGGLLQAADGSFYGTTNVGGAQNFGSVFKLTGSGSLTTLYSFCSQPSCIDGANPESTLVQAADGALYGTAFSGGGSGHGAIFKITTTGSLTTLYSFCSQTGCTDGIAPAVGLALATDGNFYGTTSLAGTGGLGTMFSLTSAGALTTLYSFCQLTNCTDGSVPYSGVVQGTDGSFYGETNQGGSAGLGTLFNLNMGLGPFVLLQQYTLIPGQQVGILGQGLTGTTNVSFNGTAAGFSVVSDTYLTAIVPRGATAGLVSVTTSGNTLVSNMPFRIIALTANGH